jgi:uncharacterized protein involved in type VI secretion and phage assembly
MTARRYYGKYRGTVAQNVDPMFRGRIQCLVPDVFGVTPTGWAMPCFPFAGPQMGAVAIPTIGAGVWVEFEQGDPEKPIWAGGWFGNTAEVPALAQATPPGVSSVVIQTLGQNTLMMSDVPGPTGGILLKSMTGALISINDVGITLSNGRGATIAMLGNTVTVNQGALVVI